MQKTNKHIALQLKKKREQLITRLLKGRESSFLSKYTTILDDYFYLCFENSIVGPRMDIYKKPYAIIALGGYGRKEQCVSSDIDLLFLFDRKVPREAEELIHEMIYPLWDLGLEVGYATRSMKECIQLANKQLEILAPLLDARFIAGMSSLFIELVEQVRTRIILGRSKKIISSFVERNRARHHHFGDSTHLLEPNLKEGRGGLRDYHTMLWIARIKSNIKDPEDLVYQGYLSHDEFQDLNKALEFIWNVRNHLHYLTSRKSDQLYFDIQQKLAQTLNYKEKKGQLAVERFLGKLHGQMAFIKQHHLMFLADLGFTHDLKFKRKTHPKKTSVVGLEVSGNMLGFMSAKVILKSPDLLIKIFEESIRLKIPLSSEAQRLIREFSFLVDDTFISNPSNIKSFEHILVTRAETLNVLNAMLNTGFLVRFIPEMAQIVNRIQYDAYHLYPVDLHSLRTVRTIKEFVLSGKSSTSELCYNLYRTLYSRKKLLLWAALLHDIGKGEDGKGHSQRGARIVKHVLQRTGLSPAQIDTVSFLVREHLYLVKTATRRDINDEETAVTCARRIKDVKRLKMLYLLTVGDSISTGPKAWNNWTSSLVQDLFFKVLKILENGELATLEAVKDVKKKKQELIISARSKKERQALKNLFTILPPRYLLYTSVEDIFEHMTLFHSLKNKGFVWQVTKNRESDTRTVVVCAKDKPGLFAKISGVFTLNRLDILNVQAYTWHNATALSIFIVKPPPDRIFEHERWQQAEKHLDSALAGDLDLGDLLEKKTMEEKTRKPRLSKRPHRVKVDNKSSSFFTIIEVFANDFPGLLFRITDALFRKHLDVHVAKIATKIDQVVDIFYVRNLQGEKIDTPIEVAEITSEIENVLKENHVRTV